MAAASDAAAHAQPSGATSQLIQAMQAQQAEQHTAISAIRTSIGQGASEVAALAALVQGQMSDLNALTASVADLGTGQAALQTSFTDLHRKLDLLLNAPVTTRKSRPGRESQGMVVDLVTTGAPAALEEGTHHTEAPDPKLAKLTGVGAADSH